MFGKISQSAVFYSCQALFGPAKITIAEASADRHQTEIPDGASIKSVLKAQLQSGKQERFFGGKQANSKEGVLPQSCWHQTKKINK